MRNRRRIEMTGRITAPSNTTMTLDEVNGDLEIGKHVTVKGTGSPPTVKVNGTVYCEGHDTFECTLSAKELEAEDSVTVQGDLEVKGEVTADSIEVGGSLSVDAKVEADNIDIGGTARVGGGRIQHIDVGGTFE